ncbi:MAG: hemolysin III family protein [Bacteroidaceae bacterium]|nr:hemolysin III family protein [Bacteroidaceae bacterium]
MIHYTKKEERWNVGSHAAGIALGVGFGVLFLVWCARAKDGWATAGVILYLIGMLGSYITSTVYHALPQSWPSREVLRRWDHAAIYWHIAGSYSPVTLVALRDAGLWGWGLFCFVWAAAIAGTIVSFRGLKDHSYVETACFVIMGLSVLVAFRPLLQHVDHIAVNWLVAEGIFYVAGAVVYAFSHNRPFIHTVFHFFVLAGSICHIICVWHVLAAVILL